MNNSIGTSENTSLQEFVSLNCGISEPINNRIHFTIEGVMLSTICLMGVLGNVTTVYVLSNIQSKYNIFNKLLMQLIFGDSISIILVLVDFSLRKCFHVVSLSDPIYAYMWPQFIYPFIKISYTWIMCCQISIAIER